MSQGDILISGIVFPLQVEEVSGEETFHLIPAWFEPGYQGTGLVRRIREAAVSR